jgi:hypothetical protein
MNTDTAPITILSSAIGLGVYIPALLIQRQLSRHQYHADVEVLEEYYSPRQLASQMAHRDAYQQDYALAQMAHRMAKDITESLDEERIDGLLRRWAHERRDHFIMWSGFWIPIIERYREACGGKKLFIDHCRIDADISASFKVHQNIESDAREIWLWHGGKQGLVNKISVTDEGIIPFGERDHRLLMHGGGWSLGTYKARAAELAETRYALDIIANKSADISNKRAGDRYYGLDPNWQPWQRATGGRHQFPPMGLLDGSSEISYTANSDHHELYNVICRSKAIVSKPGGCTLIDSLASATPVVLLEPYGYAEKRNADIWQFLGFGISFSDWRDTGYDELVLKELHENILKKTDEVPDYVKAYVQGLQEAASRETD